MIHRLDKGSVALGNGGVPYTLSPPASADEACYRMAGCIRMYEEDASEHVRNGPNGFEDASSLRKAVEENI